MASAEVPDLGEVPADDMTSSNATTERARDQLQSQLEQAAKTLKNSEQQSEITVHRWLWLVPIGWPGLISMLGFSIHGFTPLSTIPYIVAAASIAFVVIVILEARNIRMVQRVARLRRRVQEIEVELTSYPKPLETVSGQLAVGTDKTDAEVGPIGTPTRDPVSAERPGVVSVTVPGPGNSSWTELLGNLSRARSEHQAVHELFTEFCFDPFAVFARPLLNDVQEKETGAFYDALEEAVACEPGKDVRIQDAPRIRRYITAVTVLGRAWDRADAHAREVGLLRLTTDERNRVRKAQRALDLALDGRSTASERDLAYRHVLELISGLIVLPTPAAKRIKAQIKSSNEMRALGE